MQQRKVLWDVSIAATLAVGIVMVRVKEVVGDFVMVVVIIVVNTVALVVVNPVVKEHVRAVAVA